MSSTAVVATEPTPPAEFAIPAERFSALDEAGLGWMFEGVEYPAQPDGVPWPTEEWPTADLPEGVDDASLEAGIDAAFAPRDGTGGVEAILAVQGGQLVVEEYNNWDPADPHPSWSMAKSITQAMIGILVAEGRLDVFAPAPVPEWSDPSDERHAITLDDLLAMRSCLEWQEEYAGESDVITMLFGDGKADRAHFAADRPLGVRTGFDLVLLDRHGDDPRPDHRRPGRLRRRGHGVGAAGACSTRSGSPPCRTTSMGSA